SRISGAIWHFWLIRGHLTEGRRWLEATLPGLADRPDLRGKVLGAAGLLATRQGDHTRATILLAERGAVGRAAGSALGRAEAWHMLGTVTLDRGHRAQAADYFAQALPRYQRIRVEQGATLALQRRAERGAAMILNHLSLIAHEEGDGVRAARLGEESAVLL